MSQNLQQSETGVLITLIVITWYQTLVVQEEQLIPCVCASGQYFFIKIIRLCSSLAFEKSIWLITKILL